MGNRIPVIRVIHAAVITLLLSGCGVINATQPAVSITTPSAPNEIPLTSPTLDPYAASAPSVTVNFVLADAGLTPKTYNIPVGSLVTFNVNNSLKAGYGCHLRDVSIIKKYPSLIFWKLDNIAAGTTTSGTFTAPSEPASYEIGCGISPYPPNGITKDNMTATLTVH